MIRMMTVAGLVLAAGCGGSGAPPRDGPAPVITPGMTNGGGPNVIALIGAREQVGLTGQQVVALDSIGRLWSDRQDSIRAEMRGESQREGVAAQLLVRMAENNARANEAVEAVLTDEQRRAVCGIRVLDPDRRIVGSRAAPVDRRNTRDPRLRAGRSAVDTIPGVRRGWPWCGAMRPDTAR